VIHLENKNSEELPEAFRDDDVRFTESLVAHFLREYTQEGDVVFDPFAGFGTTLVVAEAMGRVPLGMEYDEGRVSYIQSRLQQPERILHGDARQLASYDLPQFDFSITSPPNMKRGDVENPFTAYQTRGEGYEAYLSDIRNIYRL
jgi:DNA modification methylase